MFRRRLQNYKCAKRLMNRFFYLELVPLLLDHESHLLLGRIGYLENLIREKRRRNSDALRTDSIERGLVTCKIVKVTFFQDFL